LNVSLVSCIVYQGSLRSELRSVRYYYVAYVRYKPIVIATVLGE